MKNAKDMKPVEWVAGKVRLLDQTALPHRKRILEYADYRELAMAIREMKVRGAPAIGVAAAYGIALGASAIKAAERDVFLRGLEEVINTFTATRPTAVNLFKAAARMREAGRKGASPADIKERLVQEALAIHREEEEANKLIAGYGATLVPQGATVLTHCNAGSLATAGYGTALGVIRAAHEQGKVVGVFADETRPLLQGARLTACELQQWAIPVTLITDSMAGYFMKAGKISCVIVGADRIVANGDVANKIGTYSVAVLATENGVPFYVAAPTSTIDPSLATGDEIPIEERAEEEVTTIGKKRFAPRGIRAANPAFDVTPHYYISAIITEKGILREPYADRIREVVSSG
ncbi:MAG: S-methyl-5-thioribose-1-phosphate isomerase [Chloroflexi bacterium]|nr:S-methyl-5-thioribose-1-phosphate isomerase [Chloroflexota bacterium]